MAADLKAVPEGHTTTIHYSLFTCKLFPLD